MAAERFFLSETNPNDAIGGGGCACSPIKHEDAAGPFVIFNATETDSNLSPHNVVCLGCVQAIVAKVDAGVEILSAGEKDAVEEEAL